MEAYSQAITPCPNTSMERGIYDNSDGIAVENVFVVHRYGGHMPRPRSGGQ